MIRDESINAENFLRGIRENPAEVRLFLERRLEPKVWLAMSHLTDTELSAVFARTVCGLAFSEIAQIWGDTWLWWGSVYTSAHQKLRKTGCF